jgi:hypothetical protein
MSAGRAQSFGYRNVYVMPEGIEGWKKLGFPVIREIEQAVIS